MTETDSWESGGYIYTKSTEHAIYREGEVAFAGIPCDCSKKMDDTLMEAIEPYHFRDAVPFRAAYLAGYVADRYDVDMQDCIARATKRAQASTEKEMKYGLQSKGTITVKSNRIQVKRCNLSLCAVSGLDFKYDLERKTVYVCNERSDGKDGRRSSVFQKGVLEVCDSPWNDSRSRDLRSA